MSKPETLGNYQIVGKLGRGSFGTVYRGSDPGLGREVAIKVCTVDDASLRQRFAREAAISGRLQHPNIVGVYAFDSWQGVPYLVQELLDGEDLRAVVKRREAWILTRRLDTLIQIAEGLAYAHDQGVVHRDIKPANIRVLPDGRVKIMDFGIAKLANDESQLTQQGVTMGTASYLPPEQVRGGDVDQRADIFSFGVLAYELLTFERPFRGKTISALVYQILYKAPRPLSEVWPGCPTELTSCVERCLEKDVEQRFGNMAAVLDALRVIRQGLEEGRWPGLEAPAPPPGPAPKEDSGSATSHAVVSPSQMHRAVTHTDAAADAARTQQIPVTPMPPPPPPTDQSQAATQRLEASELPTMMQTPRPPVIPGAETRRIPASELPTMATPPEEAGPEREDDALATSAHEISKLVTEGKLEAAMEQLEETMATVVKPSAGAPAAGSPAAGSPAAATPMTALPIDAEAPTQPLSQDLLEKARTMAPPVDGRSRPPAVPSPPASAGVTSAASAPGQSAPPAPRRSVGTRPPASADKPSASPEHASPKTMKIAAVVAVALVVAVLGFVFLGGGADEPEPTVVTPVVQQAPPPSPPPPALPEHGVLVVRSTPWAHVAEVARYAEVDAVDTEAGSGPEVEASEADAQDAEAEAAAPTDEATESEQPPAIAEVLSLPAGAATPLRLDLPPGRYRITLALPADGEPGRNSDLVCEVTVTVGLEASCERILGEPTVLELFKENGWWS